MNWRTSEMQVVVHVSEQRATVVVDAVKSSALEVNAPVGILAVEGTERRVNLIIGEDLDPAHL